jgi:hypothetical protein
MANTAPQDVLDFFASARPFDRYTDAQGYNWMRDLQGGGGMGDSSDGGTMTAEGFRRSLNPGENVGQGETTNLYYKPDGNYSHAYFDEKGWLNPITGILAVATLGMGAQYLAAAGAAGGGAGAATGTAAAEAAGMGGSGAFLGEGALSGIGAWDGALAGAGAAGTGTATMGAGMADLGGSGAGFVGEGAASGIPAWDAAAGSGVAGAAGSTAPSWLQRLGSGAQSLMGGSGGAGGAMNWSSLIGPALSAASGAYGANQAGKAADSQLQAAREAQALQEPWRQGGMKGLNRLLEELGIGGDPNYANYGRSFRDFSAADFQKDPGYAFRPSEGEQGLSRAAAASGRLGSGRYLKDAMKFNSGLASQEYGNAFNRYQAERSARLNPLQSLSGVGQSAANTIGEYGTQGANAQAAGRVGAANAITNGLGQGYSMYQNNQLMNSLYPQR